MGNTKNQQRLGHSSLFPSSLDEVAGDPRNQPRGVAGGAGGGGRRLEEGVGISSFLSSTTLGRKASNYF